MCLTLGSQCGQPKGTSYSTLSQYADSSNSQPDICFEGVFSVEHVSFGFTLSYSTIIYKLCHFYISVRGRRCRWIDEKVFQKLYKLVQVFGKEKQYPVCLLI